jgi:shikimate dehydrogenase
MPALRLPIIGQPNAHATPEAVLRAAFAAMGAEIEIEAWERKPHLLPDAVAELRQPGFAGALIAAPHKERAATLADSLADDARTSGAVNVLLTSGGRLRGDNTDLEGVRAGLAAILPKVQAKWPRQAVVLGAGGGARAVVAVLIGAGLQHIAVFNRHLHKAEALVAHLSRFARHMELRARPWHEAIIEAELARAVLLVNASGVGSEGEQSPIPADLIPPERYLLDMVLTAGSTQLMQAVKEAGGTVANGQVSFLAGTAALVRRITGQDAPDEVLRSALAEQIGPEGAVVGD